MIRYYQEKEYGDYLAVDWTLANRRWENNSWTLEGRATAIGGNVHSVCTTGVSSHYLHLECRAVAMRDVPQKWLRAIGL